MFCHIEWPFPLITAVKLNICKSVCISNCAIALEITDTIETTLVVTTVTNLSVKYSLLTIQRMCVGKFYDKSGIPFTVLAHGIGMA